MVLMVDEAVVEVAVAVVVEVGAKDITAMPLAPTLTSATPTPATAPALLTTPAPAPALLPASAVAVAVAVVPFRRLAADNDGMIAEGVVETAFMAAVEPDTTVGKDTAAAAADVDGPVERPVTEEREGDA
jgi:hypothetical protein